MTDLTLDDVAERLMRMDPTRPGVGRLAQELVAAVGGLPVQPATGKLLRFHPGPYHPTPPVPRVLG